jgi:hypothetical protein
MHPNQIDIEALVVQEISLFLEPQTVTEGIAQFKKIYKMVPLEMWYETDIVFNIGNYILEHRPELISLGIRLNVQINLFLRSIQSYAADPETLFEKIGYSLGCFALTEEQAGVLSGLIVDTTWVEDPENEDSIILNNRKTNKKNWISQGEEAEFAIVYARHLHNKNDMRVFLIDTSLPGLSRDSIDVLPVNKTLDMAKLHFDEVRVPSSAMLEYSKTLTKMELLNGIFFGRYMIAEATVSAMIGQINHIKRMINERQENKFVALGFQDYINLCSNQFEGYKLHLWNERHRILFRENNLFITNCFKIYLVEKSIEVYQKLNLMFGMKAATWPLNFDNLLLHKVAEGDTYVLRTSLINQHIKKGYLTMITQAGLSLKDIYSLWRMKTKREKYEYIMCHFKEISNAIILAHIPSLNC